MSATFLGKTYLFPVLVSVGSVHGNGLYAQKTTNDPFVNSISNPGGLDDYAERFHASDLLAGDEGLRRVAAQQLEAHVKSELNVARLNS